MLQRLFSILLAAAIALSGAISVDARPASPHPGSGSPHAAPSQSHLQKTPRSVRAGRLHHPKRLKRSKRPRRLKRLKRRRTLKHSSKSRTSLSKRSSFPKRWNKTHKPKKKRKVSKRARKRRPLKRLIKKRRPPKRKIRRRVVKRTRRDEPHVAARAVGSALRPKSGSKNTRLLLTNTNQLVQPALTGTDQFGNEIELDGNEILPQDSLPFGGNPGLPSDGSALPTRGSKGKPTSVLGPGESNGGTSSQDP